MFCSSATEKVNHRGSKIMQYSEKWPKNTKRPGVHAYLKHPVLLLPSGPDKVWALGSHESEPSMNIT